MRWDDTFCCVYKVPIDNTSDGLNAEDPRARKWSRKGFIVINPFGKPMRLKGTKAIAMEIAIEHVTVTVAKQEIPK